MTVDISDIENILKQAEIWRQTQTINLIASENTPSEAVRRVQNTDFMGRYAEGHPNEGDKVNRYYQGTRYIDLIEQLSPQLVIMGKSLFLFPEPVSEVSAFCKTKDIPLLYDGAHVLGLIAGGQFQDPLHEGATWMTGSTHKTFPGPQRGVILGNMDGETEKKYWPAADRGVFPGSSSNHHLHSLPALVVAAREMKKYGREYAAQIVRNAQALGS